MADVLERMKKMEEEVIPQIKGESGCHAHFHACGRVDLGSLAINCGYNHNLFLYSKQLAYL